MTSYFQYARQQPQEQPEEEEVNPIFSEIRQGRQEIKQGKEEKQNTEENIIPPVGIAKPELVESFIQNLGDEEKIKQDIKEAEEYERESPSQTFKREGLSHLARASEGFLGGISSFVNLFTEYETAAGSKDGKLSIKGHFPTSEELHEKTKEATGKYLEPKTELGKKSQEVASDIGSMFSTPGLSLLQKFALPVSGQLFKQTLKGEGYSEQIQDLGKLGFMTIASAAGLGNAPAVASQALGEAERMIAQGVKFSATPAQNALNRIRNSNWFKSGTTPSKAPAIKELERIEAQISNGQIDAHMAMQLRRDINEARKELGFFKWNQVADTKQAKKYLNEVDDALLQSMEAYGKNVNPQWLKQYKLANEAFRVTQRSRMISEAVEKMAKPLKSETAKTLYHIAGSSVLAKLPVLGAAAIPGIAAAKTIQVMNRMIRSPVLRNHYLDVLKATATGNAAVIQKSVEKFDDIAKKLEHKKNQ